MPQSVQIVQKIGLPVDSSPLRRLARRGRGQDRIVAQEEFAECRTQYARQLERPIVVDRANRLAELDDLSEPRAEPIAAALVFAARSCARDRPT